MAPIQIHFYYASTAHALGHGDAQVYIGSLTVTPNPAGIANFNQSFAVAIPDGSYITATATSERGTSEFSESFYLAEGNPGAPDDLLPEGEVTIVGEFIQGASLTASHTLTDGNGLSGPVYYQWLRGEEAIAGATGDTYTLTQADVGATISVEIRYTDDDGFAERVVSAATGPIENLNDDPVGDIALVGDPIQNETLSVVLNFTDADGLPEHYDYQWYRDSEEIAGATDETYTLSQEDVGRKISVRVSYEDLQGTSESLASDPTVPIINVNDQPTGAMVINGLARQGETLQANQAFSDDDGLTGQFVYQWFRDGEEISGADGLSYTLTQADVGAQISVTAFYTDAQGKDEQVSSALTAVVANRNDAPTGEVRIDGDLQLGQMLTAIPDIHDLDGVSNPFSYQWYRGETAIAGATDASYQLQQADVGEQIWVEVRYVDEVLPKACPATAPR